MKRLTLALGAFAIAMLPASSALADTFDFSFTGPYFSGSGTFTATYETGNDYLITAVTGTVAGSTIDGILNAGSYPTGPGEVPNDNILIYPPELFGTKYFDDAGVSFELANGADVNLNDSFIFENAVIGSNDLTELDTVSVTEVSTSPSPTPEPGTLMLLGTGVLGVAGVIRRRLVA